MKARVLGLAVLGLLAAASGAGLLAFLDARLAYRSPLAGRGEAGWTPRQKALADLAAAARARAEAEARRRELKANLDTPTMVELGREIVHGKGLCFNCHKIGPEGRGTQGPDLAGVGARAGSRVPGLGDVAYLAQSLYRPDAFIAPGFAAAMTPANESPIGLGDEEIRFVVAYLQSLGGTPTVTPDTRLPYAPGGP